MRPGAGVGLWSHFKSKRRFRLKSVSAAYGFEIRSALATNMRRISNPPRLPRWRVQLALHLVEPTGAELEPQQTRRIDGAWQAYPSARHDAEAERTEEALGADEDDARAADGAARSDAVAAHDKAEPRVLCGGIRRQRTKEEDRRAGLHAPYAADADHFARVIERHAREARLEPRAAFAHALAGLGAATRAERAVEHTLDRVIMFGLFGEERVGQVRVQEKSEPRHKVRWPARQSRGCDARARRNR